MEKYNYNIEKKLVIEKDLDDFPFGQATNKRWFLSLLILFGSFVFSQMRFVESPLLAGGILYLLTILSLSILDIKFLKKLFKKISLQDLFRMFLVLLFTFVFSSFVVYIFKDNNLVKNPITDIINNDSLKILFIISAFQLILEEILFVVPFLFVYHKLKTINRNFAIGLAWIISSATFGLMHLPTYSYNLVQCLFVIGAVRVGITSAYIWRRNLSLTYIIHLAYDWIILLFVLYAKNKGYI